MEYDDRMLSSIYRLIRKSPDIVFLTADNGFPNFNVFKEIFPERFFNLGISEANMVLFAAGMASCGKTPYTFAIASFLTMRAYEFIRNDVCIPNRNVKLIGISAGLSCSRLGNTHYSIEDIAIMSALPNMSIICPCCLTEMLKTLHWVKNSKGPTYIRFNNQMDEKLPFPDYDISLKNAIILKEGNGVYVFSSGDLIYEAYEAVNLLNEDNIKAGLVYFPIILPIDKATIKKIAASSKLIITVEEHNVVGGFGSIVEAIVKEVNNTDLRFIRMGINDFCLNDKYGTLEEIREKKGISAKCIYQHTKNITKKS